MIFTLSKFTLYTSLSLQYIVRQNPQDTSHSPRAGAAMSFAKKIKASRAPTRPRVGQLVGQKMIDEIRCFSFFFVIYIWIYPMTIWDFWYIHIHIYI